MTPAGISFIPLDDGWNVLIFPRDGDHTTGLYTVRTLNTKTRRGNKTDRDPDTGDEVYRPLVKALQRAEEIVLEHGMALPAKMQSWRRKNQAPSPLQSDYARGLGIPAFENMTKGRLSDEISIALLANLADGQVAVRSGGDDDA
jgi:hypothetical protein